MDAVAALHIAAPGIAGGGILEDLGAVEELPVVFLAHLHQGLVVLVQLALGQAGIGVLLAQRRDGVHDDIHAGIGLHNGADTRSVVFGKAGRRIAGVQVVGAEGQDDPAGLHEGHRLRHGLVAAVTLELHTGVAGQRPGRHPHRTDGIVIGTIIKHTIHPGGVGIAQEERFVQVGLAGIRAFLQNGGGVLGRVDGVLILVIAALHHHRRGGGHSQIPVLPCRRAAAPHNKKRGNHGEKQGGAAQRQHKIHPFPFIHTGPETLAVFLFCHGCSFLLLLYLSHAGQGPAPGFNRCTKPIVHHFRQFHQWFPFFSYFTQKWHPLVWVGAGNCEQL